MDLLEKDNRFNLANLITFGNIACGVVAIYFIVKGDFLTAIILAWIAGGLDIADGKVARKLNLSTDFGVQLDSFADFLSFVVMPSFLLFYALQKEMTSGIHELMLGAVFVAYIISGLRRLVEFNLKADAGGVAKFFEGVPTPLGAILLWILYLLYSYGLVENVYIIALLVVVIAWSLNSKLKIPHP
ncbi:MAG: CDP-diacylglycerol---serine O-phosphatidyltransferase [Campylobacterota bacterium]|nr:CDP-diacylglycerol---serine O-phosphatidyltransferase [Campylobacterota bacterium]MDQ1340196.1 CDP-diacylglycerol---serine O-phosphatidyltransferase [Campylobacterota bacterium]